MAWPAGRPHLGYEAPVLGSVGLHQLDEAHVLLRPRSGQSGSEPPSSPRHAGEGHTPIGHPGALGDQPRGGGAGQGAAGPPVPASHAQADSPAMANLSKTPGRGLLETRRPPIPGSRAGWAARRRPPRLGRCRAGEMQAPHPPPRRPAAPATALAGLDCNLAHLWGPAGATRALAKLLISGVQAGSIVATAAHIVTQNYGRVIGGE